MRKGFRSFTPFKENYFKGSSRPTEIKDFRSYLKNKRRDVIQKVFYHQKRSVNRLSPPKKTFDDISANGNKIDVHRVVVIYLTLGLILLRNHAP